MQWLRLSLRSKGYRSQKDGTSSSAWSRQGRVNVLVFCCCKTNTSLFSQRFLGSGVWVQVSQAPRVSLSHWNPNIFKGCIFIWDSGPSFELTGCWQNSFPCDYMTKVPIFLLAVGQGPLLAPTGCPWVLSMRPLHLKKWRPTSLMQQERFCWCFLGESFKDSPL